MSALRASVIGLALLATLGCSARSATSSSVCPSLANGRGGPLLSAQCHPQPRGGDSWTFSGELQADGAGLLLTGASLTATELNGVPGVAEGMFAAAISPTGDARWLRLFDGPRRDGWPPFTIGPQAFDILDGNGQRVTLQPIARDSGQPMGSYPLMFVYSGTVFDAVDLGDTILLAVTQTTPNNTRERFVARIDRTGRLLWRTPPIPEVSHVTAAPNGMILASTLTKTGWAISVIDPRGVVATTRAVPGEARSPEFAYGRRVGRVVASANGWVLAGPVGESAIEALVLGPLGDVIARRKLATPPDCYGAVVPATGCLNDYAVDAAGALAWIGRVNHSEGILTFVGPTQGWTHAFAAPRDPITDGVIPWRLAFDGRGGLTVVGGVMTHDEKTWAPKKALFFAQFRGN